MSLQGQTLHKMHDTCNNSNRYALICSVSINMQGNKSYLMQQISSDHCIWSPFNILTIIYTSPGGNWKTVNIWRYIFSIFLLKISTSVCNMCIMLYDLPYVTRITSNWCIKIRISLSIWGTSADFTAISFQAENCLNNDGKYNK